MNMGARNYTSGTLLDKLMYWSLGLKGSLNYTPGEEKNCGNNKLN